MVTLSLTKHVLDLQKTKQIKNPLFCGVDKMQISFKLSFVRDLKSRQKVLPSYVDTFSSDRIMGGSAMAVYIELKRFSKF